MLNPRRFNESVTVIRSSDSSIMVTPLGIYRDNHILYADIYPGTRLYEKALEALEACILFPFSIEPFYYSMGIGDVIRFSPAASISAPCPAYNGLVVEAVVVSRARRKGRLRLRLEPITSYVRGTPKPYSRDYGCSIELLIALSRLRFWARNIRPIDCNIVTKLFDTAVQSFDCIRHATWDEELHSLGAKALYDAEKMLALSSCA